MPIFFVYLPQDEFIQKIWSCTMRALSCAGFVKTRKGEESAVFYLAKNSIFFRLFLSNEPGKDDFSGLRHEFRAKNGPCSYRQWS
jgi:hypothetical protein